MRIAIKEPLFGSRRAASPRERVRHDQESVWRMRLRAQLPRYLAMAAICFLAFAGARTAIFGAPAPRIERYYETPAIDIGLEGFAQDFTRAYLNWSPREPQIRSEALSRFGSRFGSEAGMQPSRSVQIVASTQVVQDEPSALGGRIVTVEAVLAPGSRTVYLAVPVNRDQSGALMVSAFPSFVGAPTVQSSPTAPSFQTVNDQELITVVQRALTNYLAGDSTDLSADLAPGTSVSYPPNQLQVINSPTQMTWTTPGGVLVTVAAQDEQGASYTLTYEIGVVKNDRWYVNSIEVIPSQ